MFDIYIYIERHFSKKKILYIFYEIISINIELIFFFFFIYILSIFYVFLYKQNQKKKFNKNIKSIVKFFKKKKV